MSVESPGRHVVAIQMLRAIAATMVVFVHFDSELVRLKEPTLGSYWLATGVDIFFVISGFIMWTSVERRSSMTAKEFLKNRIIRIVPLYWTMTAFVLIVALFAPQTMRTTQLRPFHAVASFLFIPARHPTTGTFWPLLVPGWSLNFEMLFYVLFAVAIWLSKGRSLTRFAILSGAMLTVMLLARALERSVDVMHFYADPVMLEFIMGVMLALLWSSGKVRCSYAFLALSALGFAVLWAANHTHLRFMTSYLGAFLVVAGAVFLPPLPDNALSRVGDASYSLYLTHAIVLSAIAWVCEFLLIRPAVPLFIMIGLACSLSVAFLTYNFFELPVTAALKRAWQRPKPLTNTNDTQAIAHLAPAEE